MKNDKYAIFDALNPFFEIVQEGLTGLVDGKHFFDTIAEDAFFDFRYNFPGWPLTIRGRADLMDQFSGYGDTIRLHSADGLVVHRSQDRRIVILEYDVHGKILSTGVSYDNRLISVITIENRKIVHWRDYMDSLAAWTALNGNLVPAFHPLHQAHRSDMGSAARTHLLRIEPRPRFVYLLPVGRDPIYQALHRPEQAFSETRKLILYAWRDFRE